MLLLLLLLLLLLPLLSLLVREEVESMSLWVLLSRL